MKSPEYIAHGTTSGKNAEEIKDKGFEAQEGRATVSGHLIFAFDWATNQERRKGSKSVAEIDSKEKGRIIIMKTPKDKVIDYATHTDIKIDENLREITGYSSKYKSGRKQLAIYNSDDVIIKRKEIEQAKQEIKEISGQLSAVLKENNLDPDGISSKEDLIIAIKPLDPHKKIEILRKIEELEKQKIEKRKKSEPNTKIEKENILLSIVPTKELSDKFSELQGHIENLERVDLINFTEEISKLIESNKENFFAADLDVREVVGNLLETTLEAEVIKMIRSLSVDIRRVQGYEVYNRGKDELKEKEVDKEKLNQKLKKALSFVEVGGFDIRMKNLNRYIKISANKMLKELNS